MYVYPSGSGPKHKTRCIHTCATFVRYPFHDRLGWLPVVEAHRAAAGKRESIATSSALDWAPKTLACRGQMERQAACAEAGTD